MMADCMLAGRLWQCCMTHTHQQEGPVAARASARSGLKGTHEEKYHEAAALASQASSRDSISEGSLSPDVDMRSYHPPRITPKDADAFQIPPAERYSEWISANVHGQLDPSMAMPIETLGEKAAAELGAKACARCGGGKQRQGRAARAGHHLCWAARAPGQVQCGGGRRHCQQQQGTAIQRADLLYAAREGPCRARVEA